MDAEESQRGTSGAKWKAGNVAQVLVAVAEELDTSDYFLRKEEGRSSAESGA